MLSVSDIIKLDKESNLIMVPIKHKGVNGTWLCAREIWDMNEKDMTTKQFQKLVLDFIERQDKINNIILSFRDDQLKFNKDIVSKNNLKV